MKTSEWLAWPDDPLWSWQVTRIVGLADFGAANFAEIFEVVQRIRPSDGESWLSEWQGLARRVESLGLAAAEADLTGVAASSYFRACQYLRLAQFFLPGEDQRKVTLLHEMKELFKLGVRWSGHLVEDVEIPYGSRTLPGYFLPGHTADSRRPTLIYINGADSLSEEVFFTAGKVIQEFGYNILIWDGPGVGLTLYELGISSRPDAEVFVSEAVDYLVSRPDVDADRIGLLGESFAGYLVPRAAIFEPRIRAAVVWSPIYELDLTRLLAAAPEAFRSHLMQLVGATAETFDEKRAAYSLRGSLSALKARMLLIQGSDDWIIPSPIETALRIQREAPAQLVDVRIVERDEGIGGATHCQKDNLHIAHLETLSWFKRAMA
jgi:pimeloyl-ACP methyl ester carboxylesterase